VRTSPENARRRLAARGLAPDDIEARLAAATDAQAAAAVAHVVIDNDADLPTLEGAVDAAWRSLPSP
jgi:dephospho-CoA kinase